jgi:hypothetical protein
MEDCQGRRNGGLGCRLRRLKTFSKKKEVDAFKTRSQFEITQSRHTPDSASVTVAEAAEKWLETCRTRGSERSTIDAYAQHARLHIEPFLGRLKLSQISPPSVREFEDRLRLDARSPAMVRKILTSLGSLLSDAQERGVLIVNSVPLAQSRESGGGPSHEGYAQTDLVGGHRALQITSLS